MSAPEERTMTLEMCRYRPETGAERRLQAYEVP